MWHHEHAPLAAASLCAAVKQAGHQAEFLDLNIETFRRVEESYHGYWHPSEAYHWSSRQFFNKLPFMNQQLIDWYVGRIMEQDADIIAFNINIANKFAVLDTIRQLKTKAQQTYIIAGGPGCRREKDFIDDAIDAGIDAIIWGEAEKTIAELICHFDGGLRSPLAGMSLLDDGGEHYGGVRDLIKDLDLLPLPDFSSFPFELYPFKHKVLPFESSRGCIKRCTFCYDHIYWQGYRQKSPQRLLAEVKRLKELYDAEALVFTDSIINGNMGKLLELARLLIQEGIEIRWGGFAAPRRELTAQACKTLSEAGCFRLDFGVESGSQRIQTAMGKKVKIDLVSQSLKVAAKSGIMVYASFIVGYPGESWLDFIKTLRFILVHRRYIYKISSTNVIGFLPGTLLSKELKEGELMGGRRMVAYLRLRLLRYWERLLFKRRLNIQEAYFEHLERAYAHQEKKEHPAALVAYKKAEKLLRIMHRRYRTIFIVPDTKPFDLYHLGAEIYIKLRNYPRALKALVNAICYKKCPWSAVEISRLAFLLNKKVMAFYWAYQALFWAGDRASVHRAAAGIFYDLNQPMQAIWAYRAGLNWISKDKAANLLADVEKMEIGENIQEMINAYETIYEAMER